MQGILFSESDEIHPSDVQLSAENHHESMTDFVPHDLPYKEAKAQVLKDFNSNFINYLLSKNNGNVTQAAKQCGLERQALQQIMRRYGIKADPFRKLTEG